MTHMGGDEDFNQQAYPRHNPQQELLHRPGQILLLLTLPEVLQDMINVKTIENDHASTAA